MGSAINMLTIFISIFIFAAYSQPSIAVMQLEGNGLDSSTAISIGNRLRSELFNTRRFTVVERSRVKEIMREQNIQLSGCTEATCAVEIGKLLNVQYILLGSVDNIRGLISINVRLVNVETGEMEKNVIEDCNDCNMQDVAIKSTKNVANKLAGISEYYEMPIKKSSDKTLAMPKETSQKSADHLAGKIILALGIGIAIAATLAVATNPSLLSL
jgi:TolB-like protein